MNDGCQHEWEHDWRIVPGIVLASNPPQYKLVCAICHKSSYSGIERKKKYGTASSNPKDWEKWKIEN